MTGARVALLGAHGHGEVHLRNIARLSAAGAAELVGVADPREPTEAHRGLTLRYTEDRLTWHGAGGETQGPAERTDLLENLLDHLRDPSVTLVSPLSRSAAFMAVVERVRPTEPVRAVPEAWVRRVRVGESEAVTIPDVHQALVECVESSRLLSQTSVQWAASAGRKELQG